MNLKLTPPKIEITSKSGIKKFIINPESDEVSYPEEELLKLNPEGMKGPMCS